ncbi:hypothetical protein GCM10027586_20200 [Kineococcus gypseus]
MDRVRPAVLLRAPKASAQHLAVLWRRRRLRHEVERLVAGYVGALDPYQGVAQGWHAQRRWSVLPTSTGTVSVSVSVDHVATTGSSLGDDSRRAGASVPASADSSERMARPDWEYGLLQELRTVLAENGHAVSEVKTDWRVTSLQVHS